MNSPIILPEKQNATVLLIHLTQFLENARVSPHPGPLPSGEGQGEGA